MTGGTLFVSHDVGDFLGAPLGAQRMGMRGGRIEVGGSAGDYVGHRMRRGEIVISGSVRRFIASHMVAGTIIVAGKIGPDVATGMRRGSLLSNSLPELPAGRFSNPIPIKSIFPRLIASTFSQGRGGVGGNDGLAKAYELVRRIADAGFLSRRGDRAVAGQGEVLSPLAADS